MYRPPLPQLRSLKRSHPVLPARLVALLVLTGVSVSACREELRVPYIPPTLMNWPRPYRGVAGLRVHVFNTGTLHLPEALLLRGGSVTRIRDLPVPVFLIQHPTQGLILFSTGVNPTAATPSAQPSRWLSALLSVEATPDGDVVESLQRAGFRADAVRWIIVSNLRSEHTGAIKRFPAARVVVSTAERDYARAHPADYVASDFEAVTNWKLIDFGSSQPLATFGAHIDLFGDGSCLLIDAAGATPGTMALLVRLESRPLLMADDMAAVAESLRYAARPAFAFDMEQWWQHVWRLKRFKDLVPELAVIPAHDLDAVRAVQSKDIIVHAAPAPVASTPAATPDALRRWIPQPM